MTAEERGVESPAERMGLTAGQLVQEFGYDADVDHALRDAVEDLTGADLLDEDADDVVDAVLVWWRQDDGDLADMLVDTLVTLRSGGTVWLLSPKSGRDGHIEASEVEEAALAVGFNLNRSMSVGEDWSGTKLVQTKGVRRN